MYEHPKVSNQPALVQGTAVQRTDTVASCRGVAAAGFQGSHQIPSPFAPPSQTSYQVQPAKLNQACLQQIITGPRAKQEMAHGLAVIFHFALPSLDAAYLAALLHIAAQDFLAWVDPIDGPDKASNSTHA